MVETSFESKLIRRRKQGELFDEELSNDLSSSTNVIEGRFEMDFYSVEDRIDQVVFVVDVDLQRETNDDRLTNQPMLTRRGESNEVFLRPEIDQTTENVREAQFLSRLGRTQVDENRSNCVDRQFFREQQSIDDELS